MSTEFLKSRKFWAMIAGIIATILIELVPQLAGLQDSLIEILTMLGLYIIGTGLEDIGKAGKPQPPLPR